MTKSELVQAYIRGDLDRRGFIRKLTALGVSSGAAGIYAATASHPAVMAADRNEAGFLARLQTDEDYGVGVIIDNILEAVRTILNILRQILGGLFGAFGARNGASNLLGAQNDQVAIIETIASQAQDHMGALSAMFPELGEETAGDINASLTTGGEDAMVQAANDYNTLVGIYSALLPNLQDAEQRQTMTEIAIVGGRHAALLSQFAGIDPSPMAFEAPIDPASLAS